MASARAPFSSAPLPPAGVLCSDERALLAAIRERPDDDAPRLVYGKRPVE